MRVVRTITIERKNSGPVMRKDSGWQAVSDGEYRFPEVRPDQTNALTVHPGVVQKISNVTNIRDTGQILDLGGGVQVAGVLFDGDLGIDGVVKGASPTGAPARDQIGYVQLTPAKSGSLLPAQYQQLISQAGPLGGTIDCVLSVGGGGQLMKLGRVGVGVTSGMGGPEFVMTAGQPAISARRTMVVSAADRSGYGPRGGGQGSRRTVDPGRTSTGPAAAYLTLPVCRSGGSQHAGHPRLRLRHRACHWDPADLLSTAQNRSHRSRSYYQQSRPGSRRSVFAGQFGGLLPADRLRRAVPQCRLPDRHPGGNYKLVLPSPSFPVTVGQRTISEAGGVRSYADYTGSTATLAIDTSAPVQRTFQLKDVNLATTSTLMGEVISSPHGGPAANAATAVTV